MEKKAVIKKSKLLFNRHFEWLALTIGVFMMALMNPYVETGASWCLFERIGIPYCPGNGLGHSVAFIFRGDFTNAMHANMLGPVALIIILGRVGYLVKQRFLSAIHHVNSDENLITNNK